jgi:hypothetical protein
MLELSTLDLDEIATALQDQTAYATYPAGSAMPAVNKKSSLSLR